MPTKNELSTNETVAAQLASATSSIVIDNVHTVDIVNNNARCTLSMTMLDVALLFTISTVCTLSMTMHIPLIL